MDKRGKESKRDEEGRGIWKRESGRREQERNAGEYNPNTLYAHVKTA